MGPIWAQDAFKPAPGTLRDACNTAKDPSRGAKRLPRASRDPPRIDFDPSRGRLGIHFDRPGGPKHFKNCSLAVPPVIVRYSLNNPLGLSLLIGFSCCASSCVESNPALAMSPVPIVQDWHLCVCSSHSAGNVSILGNGYREVLKQRAGANVVLLTPDLACRVFFALGAVQERSHRVALLLVWKAALLSR